MTASQGEERPNRSAPAEIGGASVYAAQEALSAHEIDNLYVDDAIASIESRCCSSASTASAWRAR